MAAGITYNNTSNAKFKMRIKLNFLYIKNIFLVGICFVSLHMYIYMSTFSIIENMTYLWFI